MNINNFRLHHKTLVNPKILASSAVAGIMLLSNIAHAETNIDSNVTITELPLLTKPNQSNQTTQEAEVDSIQKLINESESKTNDSTTTTSESNSMFETEEVQTESAFELESDTDNSEELDSEEAESEEEVEARVNDEIEDQANNDQDSGEAVAVTSATIDDDSIKSIENKNGKVYTTTNLSNYARAVNGAVWTPNMNKNTAMTVKMQALLDWNHASPGPIDGGWGMNSRKALANFQTMKGLPSTGRMDQATWTELTRNIDPDLPVLVKYTITEEDVNTNFSRTPSGSESKSKMKGLYYQNIQEMLGERFHMDVRYLQKLNKGKKYVAGETITVLNVANPLNETIDRVVANKADKTLYAYHGNKLVATYPTTVGSSSTPSPSGSFKIVNKVKMPWYKSTVNKETANEQVFMLPPGPNNPVGVVWMGLSKPSYGIHGSPVPEGISRQASAGCVRLTNWDVLEVYANIQNGAQVELK